MQFVDFSKEMIPQARGLILDNYREARIDTPALPEEVKIPPLERLAENGLSVAAVEDGRLLGFLGAYGPWKPVFCTRDTSGVFSPLHAHAVEKHQRIRLWRRLYQAAAEKWARAGAASHAITLYAHDDQAREALYMYGFGVRCMDLMRPMEDDIAAAGSWHCCELGASRQEDLTALRRDLAEHLAQSPCFMQHEPGRLEIWLKKKETADCRVFAAVEAGRVIAYIEVQEEGENFASCAPESMSICGAYCRKEYRGSGAAQAVLKHLIGTLGKEGYTRLGVDCESFNPTALGFWSKYFDAYTHSVVRRIDENGLV